MIRILHSRARRATGGRGHARASVVAALALTLSACGSSVDEDFVRRQLERGRLDAVEGMLAGVEGVPADKLRAELRDHRDQRTRLTREVRTLREGRGRIPDDELLARLETLLDTAPDEIAREEVEVAISSTADWLAERRQGGRHSKANLKRQKGDWRREVEAEVGEAPQGVSDPLLAAVLQDARSALVAKSYRRAVAIAEMAMEDAPGAARPALALRDAAVDAARNESHEVLASATRLRTTDGIDAAISFLAEERWRFPAQGGGDEINTLLKELRSASVPAPMAAVATPLETPVTAPAEGTRVALTEDAAEDAAETARVNASTPALAAAEEEAAAEQARAEAQAELRRVAAACDRLAGPIVSASGLALETSFEEFHALAAEHEPAWIALEAALAERMARTLKRLAGGATLDQLGRLAKQRADLDERRERALTLIFDTEKYFYPYRPPAVEPSRAALYAAVQREVDELAGDVHEVWDAPRSVALPRRFRAALTDLAWLRARPGALGDGIEDLYEASDLPAWVDALDPAPERTGLHDFAWDAKERRRLAYSSRVRRLNERRWKELDAIKKPAVDCLAAERDQVRVTNDYRVMLGRRALAWNAMLQMSAREHSDYMSQTGEFGHYETGDPARRTPFDRMRLAGYTFGVSENCYVGSGDAMTAHESWLGSSGHHRNILGENHTELGSGLASSYWTQNFGQSTEFKNDLDRWQD